MNNVRKGTFNNKATRPGGHEGQRTSMEEKIRTIKDNTKKPEKLDTVEPTSKKGKAIMKKDTKNDVLSRQKKERKCSKELRIGPGMIMCGGTTIEADETTIYNAIKLIVASCMESTDSLGEYKINLTRAGEVLKSEYPQNARTTTHKDVYNSDTPYFAILRKISANVYNPQNDLFIKNFVHALEYAIKDHNSDEDIYAAYVNDAGEGLIGLMSSAQMMDCLDTFFKRYYLPMLEVNKNILYVHVRAKDMFKNIEDIDYGLVDMYLGRILCEYKAQGEKYCLHYTLGYDVTYVDELYLAHRIAYELDPDLYMGEFNMKDIVYVVVFLDSIL